MSDWTKGEWDAVTLNGGGSGEHQAVRTGGSITIVCATKADARLIAAAPDLYEALRELDPANGHRTDCNERKCGECSTCRARAALAKADGRTP